MKRTWFLLPIAAAFGLSGCSVKYGGGYDEGELGAECAVSTDCADGLTCYVNVCLDCDGSCGEDPDDDGDPSDPTGCTANQDCPTGSYCALDAAICVYGGACDCDEQCGDGLTCDEELGSCVPGEDPVPPPPTCEEVGSELECLERVDCVPIYTGINCSCGPDCTCSGVEPNCVCERFDFFVCAPAV